MTTTAADPIFVDTNVLVYAAAALAPMQGIALGTLRSLAGAGVELWISRQVVREYLATLSRPQSSAVPHPPAVLAAQVGYFLTHFRVAEDGPTVTSNLLGLMATIPMGGRQVHDANIVATMQSHGLRRLLTHNAADFARFAAAITVLTL